MTRLVETFIDLHGYEPIVVSAPGRINFIGEHTDYNNGFVLPAAIDKAMIVAIGGRDDGIINLYSLDFDERKEFSVTEICPQEGWETYILGVVSQLVENGFAINGFNLVLKGNVPVGAGLSSSAALCCSTIYAINELLELGLSKIDMAWLAQKAEHTFAGVKCGIMDQFASLFGRESCAILLDCKTLEYKYIPVSLDGYKIVLMDTKVKHSLKSSEFNNRRFECEQGVNIIKNHYPHVNSLSDVKLEMLEVLENGSKIYQRCRYVVEEIKRVNDACDLLVNNNIHSFGQLMYATHNGLSNLNEVSTTELDFVVQQCLKYKDFIGARMMGGGFGGCVIAIIKEESDHLTRKIGEAYKEKFGIDMETYFIRIEDGVKRIGYKF